MYIRRAAAQELAVLMAEGETLSARTIEKMKNEIHGNWARALDAAQFASRSGVNKEKPLSFLLSMDQGVSEEARQYVLRVCERQFLFFSEQESAAIDGHNFISRLRYNEALASFRGFQQEGEWPLFMPEIFFKYPVLINDLGRAFQYASSGSEGLNVFLQWEKNLITGESYAALQEARFRLQFFSGRLARRAGQNVNAKTLFEKSLLISPSPEQTDACIWYILDLALRENTDAFIQKTEQYISEWHNKNYYNDILERVLQTLAARQDWDRIANVYNVIKDSGASIVSAYAWILARVSEEGYKTRVQLADKTAYLTSAYNTAGNDMSSVLYYRALSASSLGNPLFEALQSEAEDTERKNQRAFGQRAPAATPAMQFINGFFVNNAGEHALRYIHEMENELFIDDLRAAAGALSNAGMYVQAIRIVIRYINRADYSGLVRRDLELLFPCPYKELVDKYAAEMNIAPEMLFGLIRTESAFQSAVVSRSGAVGLTQLMPSTAQDMAGRMRRAGMPDYSGDNLNLSDPEQNIHIGSYYLNYLVGRFEDNLISLLAYNGGMNRIRRLRTASSLPADLFMETISIAETRDYGRKVMGACAVYKALYY